MPGAAPGCGIEGAAVIFRLDGRRAPPDGVFASGRAVTPSLAVSDEPPPAPSEPPRFALALFEQLPGRVYVTWEDTSRLETRFEPERWQPVGDDCRVTTFTLRANLEETLDQLGDEGGRVFYRLRACRDRTCSPWTGFIEALLP